MSSMRADRAASAPHRENDTGLSLSKDGWEALRVAAWFV
jgi:hypothetical protein